MNNDLISREALKKALKSNCDLCHDKNTNWCEHCCPLNDFKDLIDNAPTVELDESVIQKVLKPRCMTVVANEYLIALHGNRPQGEWARHDEWVGGEYVGGFYHVNCPCIDLETAYYSKWRTHFCPNCGAKMKKGGAE